MVNKGETLLLVAIKGKHTQVVKEGVAEILQGEKKKLCKNIAWKGWSFQIRTKAGYAAVKIWTRKPKKK